MSGKFLAVSAVLAVAAAAGALFLNGGLGRSKEGGYWAAPPGANQGSIKFDVKCSTDPDGQIENQCSVTVTATKTDGTKWEATFPFAKGSTATAVAGYFKAKAAAAGIAASVSADGHTLTLSGIKEIDCTEQDGKQIEHTIECGTGVTEVKITVKSGEHKKAGNVKVRGTNGASSSEVNVPFAEGDDSAAVVNKIRVALQAGGWGVTLVAPDTLQVNTLPGSMPVESLSLTPQIQDFNDYHWKLTFGE